MKQLKRPKNLKPGDIVEVWAYDHSGSSGWWSSQANVLKSEPFKVKWLGYFIGFAPNGTLGVMSGVCLNDGAPNSPHWILWEAVYKIRKIK